MDDDIEHYSEAVEFVRGLSYPITTSAIQRKFRLGYNRAARIIEALEKRKVISTPDTMGRRGAL